MPKPPFVCPAPSHTNACKWKSGQRKQCNPSAFLVPPGSVAAGVGCGFDSPHGASPIITAPKCSSRARAGGGAPSHPAPLARPLLRGAPAQGSIRGGYPGLTSGESQIPPALLNLDHRGYPQPALEPFPYPCVPIHLPLHLQHPARVSLVPASLPTCPHRSCPRCQPTFR